MKRRRPRQLTHRHLQTWHRRRRANVRSVIILGLIALFMLPLMTVPALAAGSVGTLPKVTGLSTNNLDQDTLIYDRNGIELADIGQNGDHRIVVPLNYVSPWLLKATIAIEDRTFYKNDGIDVNSIIRAAIADYEHHSIQQGGSTITQQLVKQVFIGANPPNTLQRKLKEAVLALEVNQRYSKNDVLSMYVNTIYYGSQSYGVEAAARAFFHTNAHDLTLGQAAMLAGLPQAPTGNSPVLNPAHSKVRQAQVLQAMVNEKMITAAQAEAALKEQLQVYPPTNQILAPHFVEYVLGYVKQKFHIRPGDRKGYRIYTSLDLNLQQAAESIIHKRIAADGNYYNFHDAALVSMDPRTGEVLAMVGGNDERSHGGQINMATATRQPGSSFKIYTYTAAIESRRVNMTMPVLDQPMTFPLGGGPLGLQIYKPQNYDGRYHGTLPVKMAMGNSLNIPALKVEMVTGIPAVLDVARRMGVTSLTDADYKYGISLTLGSYAVSPLDMATGASTLATLGVRHMPAPVLKIINGLGDQVFKYDSSQNEFRAVSPQVAYIIDSIMSDDRNRCMEFGCGGDLTLPGRKVAAKTGTTQDFRDNWTVGFTPTLTTAVWVGNPDYTPLSHNSTGIVGAAPIWHRFMQQALAKVPNVWYQTPAGLDQIGDNYYLPGTEFIHSILDQPWPTCHLRLGGYDPARLTADQTIVNGVPCVLATGENQSTGGKKRRGHGHGGGAAIVLPPGVAALLGPILGGTDGQPQP